MVTLDKNAVFAREVFMITGPLTSSVFRKVEWAARTLKVPEFITKNELLSFKWPALTRGKIRVETNGSYQCFTAVVSLHCNPDPANEKPYKGGLRVGIFSLDVLQMLAVVMTFKNGTFENGFGGGKFGIVLDKPITAYSAAEIHRIVEISAAVFIEDLFIKGTPVISPHGFVTATDSGSKPEHMDAIHRKFWETSGGRILGSPATGKTEQCGGIPWRDKATVIGGMEVFERLAERDMLPSLPSKPRIIIQGLGQVGSNLLPLALERDWLVVGVANATGGVHNPQGIPLDALPDDPNGSLGIVPGTHCGSKDILYAPCEILALAASENQLTKANASKVSSETKVVMSFANYPTSAEADEILQDRGVFIIPDILCNGGGVSVSFWEWALSFGVPTHPIETRRGVEIPKTPDEIRKKLTLVMRDTTDQVCDYAHQYEASLSDGAWLKGVHTVSKALIEKHGRRWAPRMVHA